MNVSHIPIVHPRLIGKHKLISPYLTNPSIVRTFCKAKARLIGTVRLSNHNHMMETPDKFKLVCESVGRNPDKNLTKSLVMHRIRAEIV